MLKAKVITATGTTTANVSTNITFDPELTDKQTMISASIFTVIGNNATSKIDFIEITGNNNIHILSSINQNVTVKVVILYI